MDRAPAAFAYDWRTRFGLPITAVFDGRMSWAEAWDLFLELMRDPSSHVAATLGDWEYPLGREGLILSDFIDITRQIHTKPRQRSRMEPYPRPFEVERPSVTKSRKPTVDQATIRRAMRKLGHHRDTDPNLN